MGLATRITATFLSSTEEEGMQLARIRETGARLSGHSVIRPGRGPMQDLSKIRPNSLLQRTSFEDLQKSSPKLVVLRCIISLTHQKVREFKSL